MIGDKIENHSNCKDSAGEDDGDVFPLPGFRFHPTDEELVGFYLSRKVQKKSIKMDIVKHVDIYKFDPWDIPRWSNTESESYFFCKRGRKYRNSIRPNRVTKSGFWKATGIDKPVYSDSNNAAAAAIIGLKKTLVYYRGSAGKGTKTEWMMHEFRLPTNTHNLINPNTTSSSSSSSSQEAEVWTLCRIFKRNVSSRKYTPDWREVASSKRAKPHQPHTSSIDFHQEAYISFGDADSTNVTPRYIDARNVVVEDKTHERNMFHYANQMGSTPHDTQGVATVSSVPEFSNIVEDNDQVLSYENWDELRSMVDFAFGPSSS